MNKKELIASMAEKANEILGGKATKKDAEAYLNAFMATVNDCTGRREDIQLVGFGTFSTGDRAARNGRNPRTKEDIVIPAKVVPVFKAGEGLKNTALATMKPKKVTKPAKAAKTK